MADEAVCIGPPEARLSYLNAASIIAAAEVTDSEAIHPGYGLLSENADFAEQIARSGFRFIGPPADILRQMGNRMGAKQVMKKHKVACVPGADTVLSEDQEEIKRFAAELSSAIRSWSRASPAAAEEACARCTPTSPC